MNLQLQTLLGAAAATIVTTLAAWLVSRRKDEASAADSISAAAGRLVGDLSADNEKLRTLVSQLDLKIQALTGKVEALTTEIRSQRSLIIDLETDNASLRESLATITKGD